MLFELEEPEMFRRWRIATIGGIGLYYNNNLLVFQPSAKAQKYWLFQISTGRWQQYQSSHPTLGKK